VRFTHFLQLETPENTQILQVLRSLVALNESLKSQESQFRANCQDQMKFLKEEINKLNNVEPDDEELQRIKAIEAAHQEALENVEQLRQAFAKKNREIASLQRKIDEVPSRTELQQYQRMFVELYDQVSAKLIETKKYYNSYNTLNDTKNSLQKEVSILNSIESGYAAKQVNAKNKEKMLESLQIIIDQVAQNLTKAKTKLDEENKRKDALNKDYLSSVEVEREYYKLTKDFQIECTKNEQLLERIESKGEGVEGDDAAD